MNKADLVEALAPRLGGRAQAVAAVESVVDVVLREVAAGGSVTVTGFGVFEGVERAPRTGRNPRTGQAVPIAGTRSPRFRPATYFRQVVADPSTLPSDGLAGVRVATHDETERAGAPLTVRRTEPVAPGEGAVKTEADRGQEEMRGPRRRGGSSGTPDTVRRSPAELEERTAQPAAPTTTAPQRPAVLAGGDITQSMIAAKKAKLARAKDERASRAERGGGGKGRKKEKGAKSPKGKKGGRSGTTKDRKGRKA